MGAKGKANLKVNQKEVREVQISRYVRTKIHLVSLMESKVPITEVENSPKFSC